MAESDSFGLLGEVSVNEPQEIYTIDDVLGDDALGLLDDGATVEADPNDIFRLTHVSKPIDMPDHIAKRKQCKEFEQFEPLFKQIHADLIAKKKVTRSFTSERCV